MFNFKNFRILICLVVIISIILPIGIVFADEASTILTTVFMGPTGIPAGFVLSALQGLNMLPEVKTGISINPVDYVYSGIIMAASSLIGIISSTLLQTGQAFLGFVINGDFVGKSITDLDPSSSTYNFAVAAGWGIAKNLANAALVIGLVIIAINIILGKDENKSKKNLISFIIIALLINFTPVICGFIIDGSNILTKSFMSGGINPNFADAITSAYKQSYDSLRTDMLQVVLAGIVFLIFSLIAFFIYVLYALLFLARYVILMILVIASPIAFATYVFPQSKYIKKIFPSILYWDDWWENFVQWCVIGIPAGLFIYISNMIMSKIVLGTVSVSGSENIVSSLIGSLFNYSVPLIILVAGFFITISAGGQVGSYLGGVATGAWAATGGKYTKRFAEKAKEGGEWMIEGGKRTAAGVAIGGLSGIEQGVYGAAGKGTAEELKGGVMGGLKGFVAGAGVEGREKAAKQIAEIKETVGWTKRGEYANKQKKELEDAQKEVSNLSDKELEKMSEFGGLSKDTEARRWGAILESNKRGKLTNNQLDTLAANKNRAGTFGVDLGDIAKARPDYASKLVNKSAFEVVAGMSPADAGKKINSSAYLDHEVLSSIAASNPKAIDGKLGKGSGKDIENIKNGYVNLIKHHIPTANIDVNDLKSFVRDKTNEAEIKRVVKALESSPKKEDQIMAKGLEKLSRSAYFGKFN